MGHHYKYRPMLSRFAPRTCLPLTRLVMTSLPRVSSNHVEVDGTSIESKVDPSFLLQTVNLKNLKVGESMVVNWRSTPIFIRHRTEDEIHAAQATDTQVFRDPATDAE